MLLSSNSGYFRNRSSTATAQKQQASSFGSSQSRSCSSDVVRDLAEAGRPKITSLLSSNAHCLRDQSKLVIILY